MSTISYQKAGVDIDAGNRLVEQIKPLAEQTQRSGVLGGLGGFGALFELPVARFRHPVLVAGTDGVGTKLKLAITTDKYDTIGIDLVAMCVNDLLVQGAEPLFFLDYYASSQLRPDTAVAVIKGIAHGCRLAGAALIGGETAEMPGIYLDRDFDIAGFCVGIVEKDRIIDGTKVRTGDSIIGIASSGPHSNGYSLIRKIIDIHNTDLTQKLDGRELGKLLLEPTRIYVKPILNLLEQIDIHAMAHITGGGLYENVPRVLPKSTRAVIDTSRWQRQAVFSWISEHAGLDNDELHRTFNCGIGMVLIVAPEDSDKTLSALAHAGEKAWLIGSIDRRNDGQAAVELVD